MSQAGIHLANGTPGDETDLFAMRVRHYTALHFQADYLLFAYDVDPAGVRHVRFYQENWRTMDPVAWGAWCAGEYLKERRQGDRAFTLKSIGVRVTLANEPNLPGEGGNWSWDQLESIYHQFNAWYLAAAQEFYRLTGVLPDFAAVAQGHSDDQNDLGFVGLLICQPAIVFCDWLHCHDYWLPGRVLEFVDSAGNWLQGPPEPSNPRWPPMIYNGPWRFILTHMLYPDKQLFISEAGQFDTRRADAPEEIVRWFKSLRHFQYLRGATPFIFRDPTGAHSGNDWGANKSIEAAVRAAVELDVDTTPEHEEDDETMTLSEQYPNEYAAWVAAGGIDNNFRSHLIGVGTLPATKDNLVHLLNEEQAKLNQIRGVADRLPLG